MRLYPGGGTRYEAQVEGVAVGQKGSQCSANQALERSKERHPLKTASPCSVARECCAVGVKLGDDIASPLRRPSTSHICQDARGPQTEAPALLPFNLIHSFIHFLLHRQSLHDTSETAQHRTGPAHLTSEPSQSPSHPLHPAPVLFAHATRLDTLFAQTNHATKGALVSHTPDLALPH